MSEKSITSKQAGLLLTKIRGLVEDHTKASMDLCWACFEADTQMVRVAKSKYEFCWKVWGYPSWEEFCGQELGLHMTTAYAYKKVWEVFFVDLAGAWDKDLVLPITKMRILTSANLTKRNVEGWLKKAKKMNCRKLRAEVYGTDELHSFAAMVSGSDMRRIQKILKKGRDVYGEDESRGKLLVHILQDWANRQKGSHLRVAA